MISTIMTDEPMKIEAIENAVLKIRIEQLEKQWQGMNTNIEQHPTVRVSVSDMNQMFSNNLYAIDIMLAIVAFVILLIGSGVGFFGWKAIKNAINGNVNKETEKAIAPLRQKYETVIAEQAKQEKEIEAQGVRIKAEHHFSQACDDFFQDKFKEAIINFDKAISFDPEFVNAYVGRGFAKANLKQYEAAIDDYNKAIYFDYNNDLAYFNKACAYALMGKEPKETLEILARSIELDIENKKMAREDDDFESLRDNLEFCKLVGIYDKDDNK